MAILEIEGLHTTLDKGYRVGDGASWLLAGKVERMKESPNVLMP